MVIYGIQENLTPNLLFIDGLTRCGKSVFSPLIGTFKQTEQIRFYSLLEQIIPAMKFGSIEINYAQSLLRTQLNEFAYDIKLSRNANFRPNDQTSIYNHPNAEEYKARLRKDEGDDVIEEIRHSDYILPIMLHDAMASMDSYLKLHLRFKLIEIYRHPVDLVQSQYIRGWGNRYGYDPRSFTLTTTKDGCMYPWFAVGNEREWESYSDLERTIWMTITLLERSISNHTQLGLEKNYLTLKFEDLVTDPSSSISKISHFIGKSPTEDTWKVLAESNIPRNLDIPRREELFVNFKKKVRDELLQSFISLVDSYEHNCYGVPHFD